MTWFAETAVAGWAAAAIAGRGAAAVALWVAAAIIAAAMVAAAGAAARLCGRLRWVCCIKWFLLVVVLPSRGCPIPSASVGTFVPTTATREYGHLLGLRRT